MNVALPEKTPDGLTPILIPIVAGSSSSMYLWQSRETANAWKRLPPAGERVHFRLALNPGQGGRRGPFVAFLYQERLVGYVEHADYPTVLGNVLVDLRTLGMAAFIGGTVERRRPRRKVSYDSIEWRAWNSRAWLAETTMRVST